MSVLLSQVPFPLQGSGKHGSSKHSVPSPWTSMVSCGHVQTGIPDVSSQVAFASHIKSAQGGAEPPVLEELAVAPPVPPVPRELLVDPPEPPEPPVPLKSMSPRM